MEDDKKAGTGAQQDDQTEDKSNETPAAGAAGAAAADDELPKSQADLDALVQKRIDREKKKWAKESRQAAPAVATTLPAAGTPAASTAQATAAADQQSNADLDTANRQLLETRAQLEAFKNGVKPNVVEDAVYLAMREAEKSGDDLDEDSINDALKAVLKRHPEWKNDDKGGKGTGGGFRVGADGGQQQTADNQTIADIFGNTKKG